MILEIILIVIVIINRIAIKNIGDRVFDIETKDWLKKLKRERKKRNETRK